MDKAENEIEEGVEVEEVEQTEEAKESKEAETPEGEKAEVESDEVVVSIGEESPASEDEQQAPEWVKELRRENREKAKRIRELEAERETRAVAKQPETLGPKPTLEGCDFDADKFERDLTTWHARKRAQEEEQKRKDEAVKQEQQAWQARLETYGKQKSELKVRDFEDAESVMLEALDVTQQGVVLSGAENPALVVYALGKNPAKAKELAAIKDPVKFAFAVAKLETQLKVTPRNKLPAPESRIKGSAPMSSTDAYLAKLDAEAERTGDRSKVAAYLREQRRKAAA